MEIIKLMDFGLAHYDTSRITRKDNFWNNPISFSRTGIGKSCGRVDGYSHALGILTYELVTGVLPFRGENLVTVITQHLYSDPVSPSNINLEIPRKVDPFILKMLAKTPEERPASISEVVDELILI